MMSDSKSLLRHLTRGAVGLGSFALAATFANVSVLVPLILLPVALLALGGCPMCWLTGLAETLAAKATGSSARRVCADGKCR